MEFVKAERKSAEKARMLIMRLNLLDSSRSVQHSRSYVYFPIHSIRGAKAKKPFDRLGLGIVSRAEAKKAEGNTYREQLGRDAYKKRAFEACKGL